MKLEDERSVYCGLWVIGRKRVISIVLITIIVIHLDHVKKTIYLNDAIDWSLLKNMLLLLPSMNISRTKISLDSKICATYHYSDASWWNRGTNEHFSRSILKLEQFWNSSNLLWDCLQKYVLSISKKKNWYPHINMKTDPNQYDYELNGAELSPGWRSRASVKAVWRLRHRGTGPRAANLKEDPNEPGQNTINISL